MRRSALLVLWLAAGLLLTLPGSVAVAQQKWNVKIGGTTLGGAFYPVAAAIGQVLNQKTTPFTATVQTTPGAGANVRLLARGEIDMGLSVTPITYSAVNGLEGWDRKYPVTAIMTIFPNAMTFITLESSAIRSIEDLRGKRVTAGGPGAQWEAFIEPILSLYGMSFKDLGRVLYMGQEAAANALRDGVVDAVFLGGGNPNIAPTPSLASLESTHRMRILFVPEDRLDRLKQKTPFINKLRVRGGVYKAQPEDAIWPDVGGMHLIVSEKADAEMVYQLVKAIYENREEIAKINPLARDIAPERAAQQQGTPYHQGAIRYYKEIKIWREVER